jgi:hypothetical protein
MEDSKMKHRVTAPAPVINYGGCAINRARTGRIIHPEDEIQKGRSMVGYSRRGFLGMVAAGMIAGPSVQLPEQCPVTLMAPDGTGNRYRLPRQTYALTDGNTYEVHPSDGFARGVHVFRAEIDWSKAKVWIES